MQKETVAKSEEKTKLLNAFFPSAFKSKSSCPQGTQSPELEDWDKEQNEAPCSRETVRDMLCHSLSPKSMGLDGIHPQGSRELAVVIFTSKPGKLGGSSQQK